MNTKKKLRTKRREIRTTAEEEKMIIAAAKKFRETITDYLIESARQRSTFTGS